MNELKIGFVAPVTNYNDSAGSRCECTECKSFARGVTVVELKPKSIDEGPGWIEIGGGE